MKKTNITLTQEQLTQIIANAIAEAMGETKTAQTKKSTTKKTTRVKKTAPKVEKKVATVSCTDRVVKLDGFLPYTIYKHNNAIAESLNGHFEKGESAWVFKSKANANKFANAFKVELTDEEYNTAKANKATSKNTYTDEEKDAYKKDYDKRWKKYVADCEKKGVKRTKEMNREMSAKIRAEISK